MEYTKPKTFVFVLMPFDESFQDIYEAGIKQACRDAGAYCERVDEQDFTESILERVYNQISKADIIVAEMTGRNPNVFYEVGYSHALNKQVILLTRDANDIPFDLKHYPHIVYGGKIARLKEKLETRVRWCIENPKQQLANVDWQIDVSINDVPLRGVPTIRLQSTVIMRNENFVMVTFELKLSIHNPTSRVISKETFDFAIVMPQQVIPRDGFRNFNALPDGRLICNLPRTTSIFPNGWENINCLLGYKFTTSEKPMPIEMALRLFKEVDSEDLPFIVTLEG